MPQPAQTFAGAGVLRQELTRLPGRGDVLRTVPGVLLEGWKVRGRAHALLAAAIVHATSVSTWQSLVERQGLSDDEATSLLAAMVRAAPKLRRR